MKAITTSRRFGEILALVALVIWIATELLLRNGTLKSSYPIVLETNLLSICEDASMAVAIAAIAVKFCRYKVWQIILAAIALVLLVASGNNTGDYRLAQGFVLLLAVAGIRIERLCATYYRVVLITVIVLMLFSVAGFIFNKDDIPNRTLVFSFGLGHPNQTGCVLFGALSAMAISVWDRSTWKVVPLLAVISAAFSYAFLSSHASSALLLALAMICVIGHIGKVERLASAIPRSAYFLAFFVMPLCMLAIMMVCTVVYDAGNPALSWFNNAIHGRLYYAHEYYIEQNGFTLFGRVDVTSAEYHTGVPFHALDSGYCQLGLVVGLLPMLALVITFGIGVWRLFQERHRVLLGIPILMVAFYLLVEAHPLYIAFSIVPLLLSLTFASCRGVPSR